MIYHELRMAERIGELRSALSESQAENEKLRQGVEGVRRRVATKIADIDAIDDFRTPGELGERRGLSRALDALDAL